MGVMGPLAAVLLVVVSVAASQVAKPNVVLILADDLDETLGSAGLALNKTRQLVGEEGAVAANWFAQTPICCPSRAEILTGRYFHNLRTKSPKDAGCMHVNVSSDPSSAFYSQWYFAPHFQQAGYTVGVFGKHLNSRNTAKAPPGVDRWFVNGGGNYFSPTFTTLDNTGKTVTFNNCSGPCYSTTVISNVSRRWIRDHVEGYSEGGAVSKPFMAYIAVKAPHIQDGPGWPVALPDMVYNTTFEGVEAPRTPNWNKTGLSDHHWLIRTQPGMSHEQQIRSDELYRARLRSLLSVDDLVTDLVHDLQHLRVFNTTFLAFTSDHGFQMGQFGMPEGKWNSYDHDVRVPMIIRGPGIPAGTTFDAPATHVDLMPTLLGFAGVTVPSTMDGRSVHNAILGGDAGTRSELLLEYFSVGSVLRYEALEDCENNTFRALRVVDKDNSDPKQRDLLYAEYTHLDDWDFTSPPLEYELFDLTDDPFQMKNIVASTSPSLLSDLRERLRKAFICRGTDCP
eukprot:Hpha_TRINITY_DN16089_c5_g3::TRINITY_DN16089_c5_g3_i1::g.119496::m.119496/K01137/GNS; N-acetylglucosamine-6-sulfatase